jgi:[protein-PII] uridylyltransferase
MLGTLLHDVGKAFGEPHSRPASPSRVPSPSGSGWQRRDGRARRPDGPSSTWCCRTRPGSGTSPTPPSRPSSRRSSGTARRSPPCTCSPRPTAWPPGRPRGRTGPRSCVDPRLEGGSRARRATPDMRSATAPTGPIRARRSTRPGARRDPADVRAHLRSCPTGTRPRSRPRAVVRHSLMAATRPGRPRSGRGHAGGAAPRDEPPAPSPGAATSVPREVHDDGRARRRRARPPGWFAKVAGVVALHGGSIVAADAFTRDDGLAVDTFRSSARGRGGSWWARVEGDLAEAAAGRLAVRARVGRKARTEDRRVARLPEVTTTVTGRADTAGTSTIVEVHTVDRLGVLYAIATALAELELDIVVARIRPSGTRWWTLLRARRRRSPARRDPPTSRPPTASSASSASASAPSRPPSSPGSS